VEKLWSKPSRAKSALDRIQHKLKLFKKFFKGWDFSMQGELREERKETKVN
jgi:hypothetical protein